MTTMRRLIASGLITIISMSGCFFFQPAARASADLPPSDSTDLTDLNLPASEMRGLIERYSVDRASLNRFHTVAFSPARLARLKQFCSEWRARLAGVNFDSMSQDGRVDYLLFKNHLSTSFGS